MSFFFRKFYNIFKFNRLDLPLLIKIGLLNKTKLNLDKNCAKLKENLETLIVIGQQKNYRSQP